MIWGTRTVTEWGVQKFITVYGQELTKVFVRKNRADAEAYAARPRILVKSKKVVRREVTTTPWEEA